MKYCHLPSVVKIWSNYSEAMDNSRSNTQHTASLGRTCSSLGSPEHCTLYFRMPVLVWARTIPWSWYWFGSVWSIIALLLLVPLQVYFAVSDTDSILGYPCSITGGVPTLVNSPLRLTPSAVSFFTVAPNGKVSAIYEERLQACLVSA